MRNHITIIPRQTVLFFSPSLHQIASDGFCQHPSSLKRVREKNGKKLSCVRCHKIPTLSVLRRCRRRFTCWKEGDIPDQPFNQQTNTTTHAHTHTTGINQNVIMMILKFNYPLDGYPFFTFLFFSNPNLGFGLFEEKVYILFCLLGFEKVFFLVSFTIRYWSLRNVGKFICIM